MERVAFTVECGFVYFACGMWMVRDKEYKHVGMFETEEKARQYAIKLAIATINAKDYI